MKDKKEELQRFVVRGFELLEKKKVYQQVNILRKLETLGKAISAPSLSNILSGKTAGTSTLRKASEGIRMIIEQELGLIYNESSGQFTSSPTRETTRLIVVPEYDPTALIQDQRPVFLAEGRPSIKDKVDFFTSAQREITELGVRLKTFTDYFFSRNQHEFAKPLKEALIRGVHLNLYLLDPDCNEAHLYFRDRARVMEQEGHSIEEIRRVFDKLRHIHRTLEEEGISGQFRVFTYKHIPYNHFLIVDGPTPQAKMMVSHYMYGIRRADSPVITFSKQSNYDLYRRYRNSFKALTQDARPLDW